MRRSARGVLVLLAAGMLAVVGGDPPRGAGSGPSPSAGIAVPPSVEVVARPLPVPAAGSPGGPGSEPAVMAALPADIAEAYTGAALVERIGGCSGVLVAPRTGPIPADAPAYVLTNGHCIDLLPPSAVRRDLGAGGSVAFGRPGALVDRAVGIRSVPWASMKSTDLAVLELDTTLRDLAEAGIRPVPLGDDTPLDPGRPIVIVGGPGRTDGGERRLLLSSCTLGERHDLVEEAWWWDRFLSNRCAGIRHGSSGSPILDAATGTLVGLVNTGTAGSEGRSDCMFDRPCEVTTAGGVSRDGAVYGPAITGLTGCFDAAWTFTGPGGTCPLDPGFGLEVEGATEVTNPDRRHPSGRPAPTTWNARLRPTDPAITHLVAKTGPLGVVDCQDRTGYGDPVALADMPIYDAPLPRAEGHHQLCLLGGPGPAFDPATWQQPRFATVVTTWIDRTPPIPPLRLTVRETADGWEVEPEVVAPELVTFTWKWGPSATTDCQDPAGYAVYRHHPRVLPRADAPTRLCVIGYDPAGNPTPPSDRVFLAASAPA